MAEDPESVALLAEEAEQRPRPGCNRLVTLLPVVALLSLAFFFTPHTKSLRGNEAGAVQLSLLLFEPVDGGIERACRGADQNDNNPSHFVVTSASDLASCQLLCLEYGGCQGVEFHSGNGRCELWIRPDGIQASRSFSPAECYRRVGILEPVDGGVDRACRGGSTSDNNPSNYEIREAQSFEDCQRECLIAAECRGIEFSAGRCEIWTRPEGIQASISLSGFQCYRATSTANTETTTATSTLTSLTTVTATSLTTSATATSVTASATTSATSILATTPSPDAISFRGVDGGIDRVCRGANENDNDPSHFEVFDVDDLEACKDLCRVTTACVGIESIGRRCEIWTRLDGIQASREVAGYQCLEAVMFAPVDGGQNRACRGNAPGDNLPEYYQIATAFSMEDCQQQCEANSTTCTGVEFSGNRCEIWNRAIWTSIALDGFQCFRYVSRVQMTFLTEVLASTWDITGGVDVECRGADPEDDSPGYYSLVEASSLQRCQDRCLALTICKGIEYRRGHCELWTRPGGIQATKPLADSVCLQRPGSSPPGAVQTKYVAHYMPWFLGFDNGYDHFCQGNAHYESYLGVYDLNNRDIIRQQLDLMKNSSIDGLWIDYQLASWNDVIDVIMEETAIRGMGVAIVMDSVTNPNIFIDAAQKMVEWTSLSHYYRHNGIPVVPIFQTPDINFQAFPFEAYYMVRRESNPPAWANGSYPWVTPSLNSLDLYYQQDHSLSSFAIGAAFRGFRDCYSDRTLITPFLQMMGPTLDLASKFQPEFVQVITWNDYSEGTMIEPSWVCPRNLCLSACAQNVQNCLTTAACDSGFDPLDCSKPYGNFSGPVDPQCNSNAIASADDDLRLLAEHIRAEAEGTLQLDYGALSTFTGLVTETEGWYYRTSEEIMMVK